MALEGTIKDLLAGGGGGAGGAGGAGGGSSGDGEDSSGVSAVQHALEGTLKELIPAEYRSGAVTTSRSRNTVTIQFGPADAPEPGAAGAEGADFSGLGTAELELLCSSLGAELPAAGGEGRDAALLALLKAKLAASAAADSC